MRLLFLAVGLPLFLGACASTAPSPIDLPAVADPAVNIRPQPMFAVTGFTGHQPTTPENWPARNQAQRRKGVSQ